MSMISAGELKRRGVSAISPALAEDDEAMITVRGKCQYVVIKADRYARLREAELDHALHEARADYAAGRIADDTVAGHLKRIRTHV